MLRFLPYVLEIALLVYCLIDCIQTDSSLVRNLPKTMWVFLIIILPLIGSIAWLVAGRSEYASRGRQVPWPSTKTAGFPEYERPRRSSPDDDPAFRRRRCRHLPHLGHCSDRIDDHGAHLFMVSGTVPGTGTWPVTWPVVLRS